MSITKYIAILRYTLLLLLCGICDCREIEHDNYHDDVYAHGGMGDRVKLSDVVSREADREFWYNTAEIQVIQSLDRWKHIQNEAVAKSAVLFIGDGMSLTSVSAARVMQGQLNAETGEEGTLHFENFPVTGFAKTYCVDSQVPDSACTANAYLTGVKTNIGLVGVTANMTRGDCFSATKPHNQLSSIADWALKAGKSVGLVTTTAVTHATPSNLYAHSADRTWEGSEDLPRSCKGKGQADHALQLITEYPGNEFQVIFGGGREKFTPRRHTDVEYQTMKGTRKDRRNLIDEWLRRQKAKNFRAEFVWNVQTLLEAREKGINRLLGLFEPYHMQYNSESNRETEPTLEQLTTTAIDVLSENPKGFFLFVEGGRIDHAHHANKARIALDETIELAKAVAAAERKLGNTSLIVVSADHSHVMGYSGYSRRGNDILGPSNSDDKDNLPYMTLSYINGPGGMRNECSLTRPNYVMESKFDQFSWTYHAEVLLGSETHSGEDVPVYATGPRSLLFAGHLEQHSIPHRIAYAMGIASPMIKLEKMSAEYSISEPNSQTPLYIFSNVVRLWYFTTVLLHI